MATCLAEKEYTVQIPRKHCKPCGVFSESKVKECPVVRPLQNDTFAIVGQLRPLLGEIKEQIKNERDLLGHNLDADLEDEMYKLPDLKNIENASISKYLRRKTKVEEIIHYSYGKTVMLIAHLNLYKEMSKGQGGVGIEQRIDAIQKNLEELTCKLYDYTFMLGIAKIKKRLCKYTKARRVPDLREETECISTIVQLSQKNFDGIVADIMSLDSPSITERCDYDCVNGIRTVRCRNPKKELRSGTGRKRRRNKNKKNKNNRKNRERKRKCRKQKNSNKRTRRHCKKEKKRNKNKSQKKKSACFQCK